MNLVLNWQRKLGYREDPFTGIPTPISKHIVGLKELQEKVNLFLIKDDRVGTISGEHGSGKTMFMRWMDEQLDPQKSHAQHYIDASEMPKREDIVRLLLSARLTFLEKFSKAPLKATPQEQENILMQRLASEHKNVLLVDNAGSLEKSALDFMIDAAIRTPTHIILADTPEKLRRFEGADKLHGKIPEYTIEQLTELLRKRIEGVGGAGTFPFDDEELRKLIKKSDHNPAKLLNLARERAIELSLKVKIAPSSSKFLSIKVQQKIDDTPPHEYVKAEQPKTPEVIDAAALQQILKETENPHDHPSIVKKEKAPEMADKNEKEDKHAKTKHDKIIEEVAKKKRFITIKKKR